MFVAGARPWRVPIVVEPKLRGLVLNELLKLLVKPPRLRLLREGDPDRKLLRPAEAEFIVIPPVELGLIVIPPVELGLTVIRPVDDGTFAAAWDEDLAVLAPLTALAALAAKAGSAIKTKPTHITKIIFIRFRLTGVNIFRPPFIQP